MKIDQVRLRAIVEKYPLAFSFSLLGLGTLSVTGILLSVFISQGSTPIVAQANEEAAIIALPVLLILGTFMLAFVTFALTPVLSLLFSRTKSITQPSPQ